jgi:hypothetical protein
MTSLADQAVQREELGIYDNKTNICFNNKLKECIKLLREENPNGAISILRNGSTSDENIEMINKAQMDIREWLVRNQWRIHMNSYLSRDIKSFQHPDYYALLNALAADLDQCESWEDVYKQIDEAIKNNSANLSQTMSFLNLGDFDEAKEFQYKCLCGHCCKNENLALIRNPFTGLHLLVACDCITKTGIISKYEFKKRAEQNHSFYITQKKRAKLQKAAQQKLAEWAYRYSFWKMIHTMIKIGREYSDRKKTHRSCLSCGKLNIEKTKPKKNIDCVPCWITKQPVTVKSGVCLLLKK